MILALTFAASGASAETAKQARVPQQAKRSTPAPKPMPLPKAAVSTDAPAETPAAPAATAPAPAAPAAVDADEGDEHVPAEPAVKVPLPAKPPTATALTVEYQRVGRDILKLQDQRGKFDCGNLQQRFKAIKLETSVATPASRMQLYVTLTELKIKLERMRGIKLDSACLANPLAPGCM